VIEIRQTTRYRAWFDALRDGQAKARILARIRRLQDGNPGQHRELAGGVLELKIDFGPGYRVYCARRGGIFILLLLGGDKSSQSDDIAAARFMAGELGTWR